MFIDLNQYALIKQRLSRQKIDCTLLVYSKKEWNGDTSLKASSKTINDKNVISVRLQFERQLIRSFDCL